MIKNKMQSHYENELWALTINPKNSYEVATEGGDNILLIWDIENNRQNKFQNLKKILVLQIGLLMLNL